MSLRRRPERIKSRRKSGANWRFALTPSMRYFEKTRQTASLPYPYSEEEFHAYWKSN